MALAILGIGTAVPSEPISQSRAAEMTSAVAGHTPDEASKLSILYGLTGVTRRHVAMLDAGEAVPEPVSGSADGPSTAWRMNRYEEKVGPMVRRAATEAVERSGIDPATLTHLVTVSCTGFSAPGFDLGLIRDLRLNPSIQRTHVGFMGCHGALNGLRVARAIAGSEPGSRVLLCAAELCSLHFRFGGDLGQTVTNALFADGAAALVAAPSNEVEPGPWSVVSNGSYVIPDSPEAMTWRIGDHGFEMTLSPEVPSLIEKHLSGWIEGWLGQHGLTVAEVGSWAVHPGGPRILDAVRTTLSLQKATMEDAREVLSNYGNISSPTILFLIDRLIRRGAERPCVALGFGPGLVVEAALLA